MFLLLKIFKNKNKTGLDTQESFWYSNLFLGTQISLGTKTLSVIFSLQVCLAAKNGRWFLDSGYSRHMTWDKEKFTNLQVKDGGKMIFGEKER